MELREVTAGDSADLYYVDMGLYDTPEYGAVYVLDAERPAVIETGLGTNTDRILRALEQLGIAPEGLAAIVVTHVHLDHAGGVGALTAACPNADVYVPAPGAQFLVDPEPLWEGTKAVIDERIDYYVEPRPVPDERVVGVGDGATVDLGDHTLVAHAAPGHAFHQAVFQDTATGGVFTGDAAGIVTPELAGPQYATPPPDFDLEQAVADVEMIAELNPTALYYSHFGAVEPDGQLGAYAELLESWVETVARVRTEQERDAAVMEYFAERADTIEAWGPAHARAEERLNVAGVLEYLDDR